MGATPEQLETGPGGARLEEGSLMQADAAHKTEYFELGPTWS